MWYTHGFAGVTLYERHDSRLWEMDGLAGMGDDPTVEVPLCQRTAGCDSRQQNGNNKSTFCFAENRLAVTRAYIKGSHIVWVTNINWQAMYRSRRREKREERREERGEVGILILRGLGRISSLGTWSGVHEDSAVANLYLPSVFRSSFQFRYAGPMLKIALSGSGGQHIRHHADRCATRRAESPYKTKDIRLYAVRPHRSFHRSPAFKIITMSPGF